MISIIHVRNPLDPARDRETSEIEARGLTLDQIFAAQDSVTPLHVSVNGHLWERSLWSEVTPLDGDSIVVAAQVRGGSLLRTLASIAVLAAAAAVTAGFGAAFAGAIGVSTQVGSSLLAGIVSIGGNLLISAFMGPSTPSQKTDTASYDPDGPTSLARSGTVIAKGFGTFLVGGNLVSSFVDVEGQDQYLNVLMCAGFGPARAIRNIQINDKDVSSYDNVQVTLRYGSNDQLPIPGFNRIVNGYPQATKCLAGQPVVVPGTGTFTEELQVDIQFPEGIFYLDNGNLTGLGITYLVEYAASGTNNWQTPLIPYETQDFVSYDVNGVALNPPAWVVLATDFPASGGICYASSNSLHTPGEPWNGTIPCDIYVPGGSETTINLPRSGAWQPFIPGTNLVEVTHWRQGYQSFVDSSNQALYNRTTIVGLVPGRYDVRVTKYGSNRTQHTISPGDNASPLVGEAMWVHSINEIEFNDLAYPNMILVGVRALATNQLSGQNINITAEIDFGLRSLDEGLMPSELMAFGEDNPACVAADMMLDTLYGGGSYPGIIPANLERYMDEWVAWAEMNDELVADGTGNTLKRHVFNGVFDSESDLWSQVRQVGQMSRAQLVPIGRDYGVFIDQLVDAPVQMFTVGNILQDSFSETFLNLDDRANQVEIQFADRTRSYRSDSPLAFMDQAAQDSGLPIKNTRIAALGVTVPAQAWHLGRFKIRSNDLLLRSGSFRCDTDAIACKYGSVVMLQHDVPSWGWGGRTLPGSTALRVLADRFDLESAALTQYSLVVRHPSIQRFAGVVGFLVTTTNPTGVAISVGAWDGVARVTRAVINGVDSAVLASSPGSVTISPPPGFVPAVGQSVVLFDTDVLETAAVLAVDIPAGAITLAAPLSRVPEDYSTYIYGEAGGTKLVRVTGVKRSSEFRSTIEWIDYDPDLYTDGVPSLGGTGLLPPTGADVTSLTGVEAFELISGSYVGFASLSWRPGPDTVGVSIYALPQDHTGLTKPIAKFAGASSFLVEQAPGTSVTYTVIGYDAKGIDAPHTSAPFVTINTVGPATNLLRGSNFASGFTYWSVTPRVTDTFVPTLTNDGQAVYTVLGSVLATPVSFAHQLVDPSLWAVGETLILSGYVMDAALSQNQPNIGGATMTLAFIKGDGTSSAVMPALALNGVTPSLTRFATAPVVIPAGTVAVIVSFGIGGAPIDVPSGATVTWSHLLLEIAHPGQLLPSPWADIDVQGHVQDVFTGGSSTSLRTQGSLLPTFTGQLQYTASDAAITISWTGLVVLWPDGSYTEIQAGSLSWSALNASTDYWVWLYYDIQLGIVVAAIPTTPVGSPASLSAAYDGNAEAACKQDGRVALTPGGFEMATVASASGGSGGGAGGGSGGGPGGGIITNPNPIHCTVRGAVLQASEGPLGNVEIEARFARGEDVYLEGRDGPERIRKAWWVRVPHWYLVAVEGHAAFGASESLTLKPAGGEHRWCSRIDSGTEVETTTGCAPVTLRRIDLPADVLHIELDGPSHEYQAGGVWTHNWIKYELPAPN